MNHALMSQCEELEKEFAAAQASLATLRQEWEDLREQVRPIEEKMAACEAAMDAIRHGDRYRELAARLPHLRRAVAEDVVA